MGLPRFPQFHQPRSACAEVVPPAPCADRTSTWPHPAPLQHCSLPPRPPACALPSIRLFQIALKNAMPSGTDYRVNELPVDRLCMRVADQLIWTPSPSATRRGCAAVLVFQESQLLPSPGLTASLAEPRPLDARACHYKLLGGCHELRKGVPWFVQFCWARARLRRQRTMV